MDAPELDNAGSMILRLADPPTEELLREILDIATSLGAVKVIVETSHEAGDAWIRAGFVETVRTLEAPIEILARHSLDAVAAPSFGSIHIQTEDVLGVKRAVEAMVPRLPGSSKGSIVLPSESDWVSVFDELCDREPEMLRRLAVEIADRMGKVVLLVGVEEGRVLRFVFFDRGRIMDEYLSVPEYHGPLPPGDVISLGANPRVVNRLTGANADRIRKIAQTADSPEDIPPPMEILTQLAEELGIPNSVRCYSEVGEFEDAIVLK